MEREKIEREIEKKSVCICLCERTRKSKKKEEICIFLGEVNRALFLILYQLNT